MVYSTITLFERWLEKAFHTIFSLLKNETHETIAREFIIQFLDIFKFYGTLYIFFRFIHLPSNGQMIVDKIASVCMIIIIIFFITTLIKIIFEKGVFGKAKGKWTLAVVPFITKVISVIIWLIGTIVIIKNLGYDVSTIIAWAGIWGIALALAAQKSLTNVFWAINIVMNKPFKIGDIIQIGTTKGTVRDLWLSYLTLTDWDGHTVMIPNETIITTSIENLSEREFRRTEFKIGLKYETTLEKVSEGVKIIEDILKEYEGRGEIKDKSRVSFEIFWSFSLELKITYFSLMNNDYKLYEKQREKINLEIKEKLALAGIEIAFPTQELIIKEKSSQRKKKI